MAAIVAAIARLDIINAATIARIFDHPVAAACAILVAAATIHVGVLRWYLLLKIQDQSIPLRRLWVITFTSYFVGNTTLGTAGVDAMRLYYIGREKPGSVGQAYLSIVVDRLLGLAGLLLVGALLFTANFSEIVRHPQMQGIVLFSAAIGAGLVLVAGLAVGFGRFIAPSLGSVRALHRVAIHMRLLMQYYSRSLPLVGLCLLISIVVHALMLTNLLVLARALFGDTLTIPQLGLAGVMATLANQNSDHARRSRIGRGHVRISLPPDGPGPCHDRLWQRDLPAAAGRARRDAAGPVFVSGLPAGRGGRDEPDFC